MRSLAKEPVTHQIDLIWFYWLVSLLKKVSLIVRDIFSSSIGNLVKCYLVSKLLSQLYFLSAAHKKLMVQIQRPTFNFKPEDEFIIKNECLTKSDI